jgi:hypothetical protein
VSRQSLTIQKAGGTFEVETVEVVRSGSGWIVRDQRDPAVTFGLYDQRGKANLAAQSLLQLDETINTALLMSADGEVIHVT